MIDLCSSLKVNIETFQFLWEKLERLTGDFMRMEMAQEQAYSAINSDSRNLQRPEIGNQRRCKAVGRS